MPTAYWSQLGAKFNKVFVSRIYVTARLCATPVDNILACPLLAWRILEFQVGDKQAHISPKASLDLMGSGISSTKAYLPANRAAINDNLINVSSLIEGLMKLANIFEVHYSLAASLTNEVLDPKHADFDSQFHGVEEWMKKHGNCELTPQEIYHLIKYVELGKSRHVSGCCSVDADSPLQADQPSCDSDVEVSLSLLHPQQRDVMAWTAVIRQEEICLNSHAESTQNARTLRVRFYSDVSDDM